MSIKSFSLLLVFVLGVVSCSIQKRKYRDGFYIALNHKANTKAIKKTEVIENIAIENKAETKRIDTASNEPLTQVEKINLFMDNKPIKHFFNKVKLLPLSFSKIANKDISDFTILNEEPQEKKRLVSGVISFVLTIILLLALLFFLFYVIFIIANSQYIIYAIISFFYITILLSPFIFIFSLIAILKKALNPDKYRGVGYAIFSMAVLIIAAIILIAALA